MSRTYKDRRGRSGSYEDYGASGETLEVYDQCCRNCRYYRHSECVIADEFDYPSDNGSDWCERWKGRRRR